MAREQVGHGAHRVDPSPWPFIGASAAFVMLLGALFWMHQDYNGFWGLPFAGQPWVFLVGLLLVLYTIAGWWRDLMTESVLPDEPNPVVERRLCHAMALFIASQTMFLFAWFWAYFDSAIFTLDIAGSWPPENIVGFDPWALGSVNTLILLLSATSLNWAQRAIRTGERSGAVKGLLLTILFGVVFTCLQAYEFAHAGFTFGFNGAELGPLLDDARRSLSAGLGNLGAIYGSTVFMVTGIHGLQVVIGTIFLTVCLGRVRKGHFTPARHFGFEAALWYWRFVIVVWLFVFALIYVWGPGATVAG